MDMNQPGQQYQFLAVGRTPGFGMLSTQPLQLMEGLKKRQNEEYRAGDVGQKRLVLDAAGCLDRLEGFLFQLARVANHARALCTPPVLPPNAPTIEKGVMVAQAADEACFDFEGLLFNARATLDRLTWFVAARHGQRCNSFTKLKGVLANFVRSDARASAALRLLNDVRDFDGILVDSDGEKALRSRIAHYSSVPEGRQIAFSTHFLENGRRLVFDCEALGWPILSTAERLGREVPYLALNLVAIYAGLEQVERNDFQLTWTNPTVSFTAYRHDQSPLRFTVANMTPDGCTLTTHALRPEILEKAIE